MRTELESAFWGAAAGGHVRKKKCATANVSNTYVRKYLINVRSHPGPSPDCSELLSRWFL